MKLMAVCCALVLAGCASAPEQEQATDDTTKAPAEPAKVKVLFPEYLLMDGFKLNEHGRIPSTRLIGGDMTAEQDLNTVRRSYSDVLAAQGWNTDRLEIGQGYFRLMASRDTETVEIRAVQGTGPTQVFLLYTPASN